MLVRLSNAPRAYSWGSPHYLPVLTGRKVTGQPEAEIWYGDHPGDPADIVGSALTLDVHLQRSGQASLPYLLKLLAAGSSLSIQAHPTRAQAREGFAREEAAGIDRDAPERTYRDDNHKPEIIVALSDPFLALAGLRPVADTLSLLDELGAGETGLARILAGAGVTDPLREALRWALTEATAAEIEAITDAVRTATTQSFEPEREVLARITEDFPGDAGILVALMMNLVTLRPGEGLFAAAGVLHAYQQGLGIELMAASDNVLRGGLTPKHLDVDELLRIVDTTPGEPAILVPEEVAPGVRRYRADVDDFLLTRVAVREGDLREATLDGPSIAVAVEGRVRVEVDGDGEELCPGEAVFFPGAHGVAQLRGDGVVYLASPGTAGDTPAMQP